MTFIKSDLDETICALATPEGVGALGIIRISGKDAISLVSEIFDGKKLIEQATHTVHLGKIKDGENILDEVLATIFIAPKSFTGENSVELSCHGSPFIQQKIVELLVKKSCRLAKPGEFTLRAFLNKRLDLSQAEAVADLIASQSAESHRTAMMQMRGGFSNEISILRERLLNFASLIELELDFAEEDVEFANRNELKTFVENIQSIINSLLATFKYGNAIKNGIPTVIVGKPNAGKSTLLNALINEERAIVSEIAGTTRDSIEEIVVIDGILFRLIDTAGIRQHSNDTIEKIGIKRTYEKIEKASIIIYLFDASTSSETEIKNELKLFENINAVVIPVANKTDLLPINSQLFKVSDLQIEISSLKKIGIENLKSKLKDIVSKDKVKNDIIVTNIRHFEALKNTNDSLESVLSGIEINITTELLAFDIRKAIFHLGEITGEITTDDLLANIFSKFCIGK